jgi:hypothetical protein
LRSDEVDIVAICCYLPEANIRPWDLFANRNLQGGLVWNLAVISSSIAAYVYWWVRKGFWEYA